MRSMTTFSSILFPHDAAIRGDGPAAPGCCADLHLDQVFDAVVADADASVRNFFYTPLHDVADVAYRHDVFRDLEQSEIRCSVNNFVDTMRMVRDRIHQSENLYHPLQQYGWFVYAVETYCSAVRNLAADLPNTPLTSIGLRGFAEYIARYVNTGAFQTLEREAQAVQEELHRVRYLVHIDGLRVHVEKYSGQSDYSADVASTFERFAAESIKDYHVRLPTFPDMDHVEEQVLECVAKLYPESFARLRDFCTGHAGFVEPVIARFAREIHFYLCYLGVVRRLVEAELTFNYPRVTTEPGVVSVEHAFDLALAVKALDDKTSIVRNSFHLSGPERIFVVTGPNQGGKTTFARTIGQCAYLAALGCPIPGTRAALTLPDEVYTHFERQESLTTLHGKLDDELVRIHDILSRATAASLVIMNESFASTTVNDALLIGAEVLRRIIDLGCVTVYVTFLDELAGFDPACVSMVGEVAADDPTQRTFRFTRRPADGRAYAAALARKYGLNHDVLLQRIAR